MALVTEVIHFDSATSTGIQTVSLNNFGTDAPKACLLIGHVASSTSVTSHAYFGIGAATSSTNRGASSFADEDNNATLNSRRSQSNAHCVYIHNQSGTALLVADLDSFTTTGNGEVKLDWSTVQGSGQKMTMLVIGGSDITNVTVADAIMPTSTGSDSETVVGFQADGAILWSSGSSSTPPNQQVDYQNFIAFWGGTNQACVSVASDDGQMQNNDRYRVWNSDAIQLLQTTTGSTLQKASFTSWDATGHTLNWSVVQDADRYWGLYIKGPSIEVATTTLPTTAGTKSANVGFASEVVAFLSSGSTAADGTAEDYLVLSMGLGDSTVEGGYSVSGDFTDPSNTRRVHNATNICTILDHAADSVETVGAIDSLTSPNVTINFTTVSGNADNYFVWAIESGVSTFTGSAAITAGATTCSADGSFTAPVYTGSSAATAGSTTCSASGTHTPPTFTGSAAITLGSVACAASGTFTAPVYTGSSAATVGATTAAASGQYTSSSTGSAAITVGSVTAAASGTHTPPTFTGSAAITLGSVAATASGTFTAPVYTGSSAATVGSTTAAASGTFTAPVYTGSAAITLGSVTCTASGVFTVPTYTGSSAATVGATTAAASGQYTSSSTGSAAITVGSVTAAASGTFTAPVYTGSAAITLGSITAAASGTFTSAVYTGSAAITLGSVTCAASGTFTAPVYTGSSAATVGATTAAASGTHTAPTFTGSSATTLGSVTAAASGTHTAPVYTGSAAVTLAAVTAAASGTFTAPVYTGSSAATTGSTTCSASGTFSTNVYTGSAAITVASVTAAASGTHTSPIYTGSAAIVIGSLVTEQMQWSDGETMQWADGSDMAWSTMTSGVICEATGLFPASFGNAAITISAVTASGSGTVDNPGTGSAAITTGAVTCASSGSFIAPTYTGSAAITVASYAGITAVGSGVFAEIVDEPHLTITAVHCGRATAGYTSAESSLGTVHRAEASTAYTDAEADIESPALAANLVAK